jgi:hypothetical protein
MAVVVIVVWATKSPRDTMFFWPNELGKVPRRPKRMLPLVLKIYLHILIVQSNRFHSDISLRAYKEV